MTNAPHPQSVTGGVMWLLRLEGLAVLITACTGYWLFAGEWRLFFWLFFLPDISFLAYFAGPRIGAACYNFTHSYLTPALLLALMVGFQRLDLALLLLIWVAHIGFDRAMGYGLKYATSFNDTHLGKIGKWKKSASD